MRTLLKSITICTTLVGYASADQDGQVKEQQRWSFLPILGLTKETGILFGAMGVHYLPWEDTTLRPSKIRLDIYGTEHNQFKTNLRPSLYWSNSEWHYEAQHFFALWPLRYYGVGPASDTLSDKYDLFRFISWNTLEKKIHQDFWIGTKFDVLYNELKWPKGTPNTDAAQQKGFKGGFESGFGISASWDIRDNVNAARSGAYAYGMIQYFGFLTGSDFEYWRQILDLRAYFPMPWNATWAFSSFLENRSEGAPFYSLSTPTGDEYLRGFDRGRVRDRTAWVLSTEYRQPLIWRIGGTVFAELGRVGDGVVELVKDEGWIWTIGVGGRFALNPDQKVNVRGDLSWVEMPIEGGGIEITIQLNEAF